jgi:hypothetical protein
MAQGGKQKFLSYLREGLETEQWVQVTARHYGYTNLAVLQNSWLDWVRRGSPPLESAEPAKKSIAAAGDRPRPESGLIVRGQSPDTPATHTPVVPIRGRRAVPAAMVPVAAAAPAPAADPAPATAAAAAGEPTALASQGWYPAGKRRGDDVAQATRRVGSAAESPAAVADKPATTAAPARPRRPILEWTRPEPAADTTAGQAQRPGRSVYDTTAAQPQTLLR